MHAPQSLLRLRELRELTLIFDPELTDTDLLALSRGGGERERERLIGDLLLDERVRLRPRGEGVYSRGEGERECDAALSLRRAGERDLFRGEGALSQSARERYRGERDGERDKGREYGERDLRRRELNGGDLRGRGLFSR